jgi:hypothetical protein
MSGRPPGNPRIRGTPITFAARVASRNSTKIRSSMFAPQLNQRAVARTAERNHGETRGWPGALRAVFTNLFSLKLKEE